MVKSEESRQPRLFAGKLNWNHGVIVRLAPILLTVLGAGSARATPRPLVLQDEMQRVEMMERVSPSVVCIYDQNLRGGGSGVLIDADGYGLTNFHVVRGLLEKRRAWGGLGDGVLYELEVLGIDITGDVAMFRLIPPKQPYRFPHAKLGDSDRVRVGDAAIAMGNPFMLSEDYSPSITLGLVTGIHRYQQGTKGNLTYSDCIQVDASINPGNSGGPLFGAAGDVIGINGRISVNTRGRFNVGFGYAITANQIKRFMPALRAGLLARHGHWEATVKRRGDGAVVMDHVQASGAAHKAGLRPGDRVVSLDGVPIASVNQVISLMGTYPADWPVSITVQRGGKTRTNMVRLSPLKPRMRRRFKVDRHVNARQTTHVLSRFQRAMLGDATAASPSHWSWTVRREYPIVVGGETKPAETFQFSIGRAGESGLPGRPLLIAKVRADGTRRPLFEFDGETAVRFGIDASERYELDDEAGMILATYYALYTNLMTPVDEVSLVGVRHLGADAAVEHFDQAFAPGRTVPNAPTPHRILEVIEWPVTEQAKARFAFDVESSRLVRVRVRDDVSGVEAVIDFGKYQDIGGVTWSSSVKVTGAGFDYIDTCSAWELGR